MQIEDSARRHGVEDADMLHAVDFAIRVREQEYDGEVRLLIIGTDRSGRLLEIVVVTDEPVRIIHADKPPPQVLRLLVKKVNTMTNDQTTSTPSEIETWLENLDVDPTKFRDGRHMRRIAAAAKQLVDVEAEISEAVIAAREAGDSWAKIGAALGISRQGAFQRFGKIAP